MKKIKIVTDSTSDLTAEEIEYLNIHVIPLSISINGETYTDGVDITPEVFMNKMKMSPDLPKSSQPAIGEFIKLYDELGKDGSEIISIHMTGNMSGTVETATCAAQMSSSKVKVIDSKFISKALAFQVREAATLSKLGHSLEEILAKLKKIRENTKLYVAVDTLENLVKGGRIGKGKAMIGSLLNIKPIAHLDNGEYSPIAKVRSKTQILNFLMKQFMKDIKGKRINSIGISHAEGIELAVKMKEKIEEMTGFSKVEIDYTTPVISTHTGPGAIGFMYYFDEF
ncbi:DegV family protein [Lederbergia galactosidilytica]|uniref:DegV domain-containing protein n=1 Tax=Lederbergia galactosidilytica TaxID=217031 RepID=A0A177ZZF7_9BACI|nr:DegV family protein [Lederbergia galactosidilytica]OAK72248.1 DegV domain-containing protein [Lederbergia galactosidilytica]